MKWYEVYFEAFKDDDYDRFYTEGIVPEYKLRMIMSAMHKSVGWFGNPEKEPAKICGIDISNGTVLWNDLSKMIEAGCYS